MKETADEIVLKKRFQKNGKYYANHRKIVLTENCLLALT